MDEIERVAILGANGTMGAGSAAVFAAGGCRVTLLARTPDKAREGLATAQSMAKSERIGDRMTVGSYDADLEPAVARADFVLEALAEDMALKHSFFERVDRVRREDSIVATVSSGLSIATMAQPRSAGFQAHFLGVHLFNPPNVIVGTEVIPHAGTDRQLTESCVRALERRFGRAVIVCKDSPAFAGNRVGFKVLNDVAQLAAERGVQFADYLIGPHTGRAMAPLATVDLVGWDVHQAIVDNVHEHTSDEAHDSFALPAYMRRLIADGHLGNKTPAMGGFYRSGKDGGKNVRLVLDPATGTYQPASETRVDPIPFVERMRELHRIGCYRDALVVLCSAEGEEADLTRAVVFGYVSYGLNRVGPDEVVAAPRDIDRIMGFGFNWAPPGAFVDLIGVKETIGAMERCRLPVPPVLAAAAPGARFFREPHVNIGRFFAA